MSAITPSSWDLTTQEATRQAFEEGAFYAADEQVHLKHIQGHFGTIPLEKALKGDLQVLLKNGMGRVFYTDVDALIQAGWVLD